MTIITFTLCRSISRQTSCGSNRRVSTTVSPPNSAPSVATCAAPWISGAEHSRTSPADSCPRRDCSHSSASTSPVMKSMPPPSVRQMSSCRHMTPLGRPVVPPV